ncbi:DUF1996 domain-containing protein [Streptomyces sp. NPDC094038]|uniref:DUF1996 domain-containing protein n=1 Tax=Streptomyces sp. NPDC094038 TaxID=3366055 RepID=UPI0037FE74D3
MSRAPPTHIHDYVGNVSANAMSSNAELAAARTTCLDGDRSTYYWPVLRRLDRMGTDMHAVGGGLDDNTGRILTPSSVVIEYRGNPVSKVVAMPRFLRLVTGDPVALCTGGVNVRAQRGCSGYQDRFTTRYPVCPEGSGPTRTLDFPSCWDGLSTDSPDHRDHAVFPTAYGVCPHATFAIPQLRITLTCAVPAGVRYAVDSFPEGKRDPSTDHGMFIDVMTDRQMARWSTASTRAGTAGRHDLRRRGPWRKSVPDRTGAGRHPFMTRQPRRGREKMDGGAVVPRAGQAENERRSAHPVLVRGARQSPSRLRPAAHERPRRR